MDPAVERMKERKRKLQEKEAERRRKEEEELRLKMEASEATLAELKLKDKERREEDAQLVGAFQVKGWGAGAKTRIAVYEGKVTTVEGPEGESRGSWVKHSDGSWGPKNKNMVIGTSLYTNPVTEHYLPSEVWGDLDLMSGLRKDNSPDFIDAMNILTKLFAQYYPQETMQKSLFLHLQLGFTNLHHSYMRDTIKMYSACLIPIWRSIDGYVRKLDADSLLRKRCTEHMDKILDWKKATTALLLTEARNLVDANNKARAPILRLYHDVVVNDIMTKLDIPDLLRTAQVCSLWNTYTNAPSIYRYVLLERFNFQEIRLPKNPDNYKPTAIRLWYKHAGKHPTTGLFLCTCCKQFHWAARGWCWELQHLIIRNSQPDFTLMRVTDENIVASIHAWSRKGGNFKPNQ